MVEEDKPKNNSQLNLKSIADQADVYNVIIWFGKQLTNNCIEKFVEWLRSSVVLNYLMQYSLIVLQTISSAVNHTYTN